MSTHPLASCELNNGLSLYCLDQSTKIAADRWYICILVKMSIPVEKKWFKKEPMDDGQFQQIVSVLGQKVDFLQKRERNFISDDVKDQVIRKICDSAMEMGRTYCGNDDFAAKYILKAFADQQRRR